ncbi:unnamed protein product, partial [Fusarium fujikuroi]
RIHIAEASRIVLYACGSEYDDMVETTIWREWEHDPMLKTCAGYLGSGFA